MAESSSTTAPRRYRASEADNDFGPRDEQVAPAPNLFNIVRYNMCTQEDAAQVWSETLEDWEMESSTQQQRDELRSALAAAFAISTSKDEENISTKIILSSKKVIGLRDLYDNMGKYYQGDNDSRLRVFVRCFEKGFFVKHQWDLLSDPANMELRNVIAARVGEEAVYARYMFDTADFIPTIGMPVSAEELRLIQRFKTTRTVMASAAARGTGEMTTRNDNTSVNSSRGTRVAPSVAVAGQTAAIPSADARMGLAGVSIR